MRRKQQQQTCRSFAARILSYINISLLWIFTILSLSQSTPECSCYLHTPDIHPPSRGHSLFFSHFALSLLHCVSNQDISARVSVISSRLARCQLLHCYLGIEFSLREIISYIMYAHMMTTTEYFPIPAGSRTVSDWRVILTDWRRFFLLRVFGYTYSCLWWLLVGPVAVWWFTFPM
jgi:hypothetical protein